MIASLVKSVIPASEARRESFRQKRERFRVPGRRAQTIRNDRAENRSTWMKTVLFLLALFLACGTSWGQTADIAGIKLTIDKSPLSAEQKSALFNKVSESISKGIPSSDAEIIVKRGLSRGVEVKLLEEFFDAVLTAKQKGLPVRPVLDRIEQGLSKGVPPEKITAAAKQLVIKLSAADRIVDNLSRNGLKNGNQSENAGSVHTVARALEKSIPEDVITGLGMRIVKQGASLSRFAAGVDSITFFVEMGMTVDQASKLTNKAIDRGYTENHMFMMQKEMSDMMRSGSDMRDIMNNMDFMMSSGHKGMQGGMSGMGSGSTMHNAPGTGPHHGNGGHGGHH